MVRIGLVPVAWLLQSSVRLLSSHGVVFLPFRSEKKKRPGGGVLDRGRPSQRVKLWARSTGMPWQDKSRKPLHGGEARKRDRGTHEYHR